MQNSERVNKRKSSWTSQQQEGLKYAIKEIHGCRRNIWKQIVKKMKMLIPNFSKSQKQCRDRYSYYLKKGLDSNGDWTQKEKQSLVKFMKEYGMKWSQISSILENRSQANIKNTFNKALRSLGKALQNYKKQELMPSKSLIQIKILKNLLDFIHGVYIYIQKNKFTVNQQSKLFKLRNYILRYSLVEELPQGQSTNRIIQLIKEAISKFKCFKSFKGRNNSQYQLTGKGFETVYSFDISNKIILEQLYFQQCDSVETKKQIQQINKTSQDNKQQNDIFLEQLNSFLVSQKFNVQMLDYQEIEQLSENRAQNLFQIYSEVEINHNNQRY